MTLLYSSFKQGDSSTFVTCALVGNTVNVLVGTTLNTHILLHLIDKVTLALENHEFTIFIDLSKAE